MKNTDIKPNILLIMPDQMRGDCLSLERHPVLLTPNIDAIGGSGVHFTKAYTTCASCIPARRSLLTGQFPATNGMVGYRGGCPLKVPTVTQILSNAGYATTIVGRYMHQSPYDEPYGFEKRVLGSTYIQDDDYAKMLDEKVPELGGIRGLGISFNGWQAKSWTLPEYLHPTNWTVKRARDVIQEQDDNQPFFLTTSFYAPHPPLIPPAFYMNRYLNMDLPSCAIGDWATPPKNNAIGEGVDVHRTCLKDGVLRNAQAGYFGLINHIDDQLYWLISEFKQKSRKMNRPWLIVFTSDHGEMLGEHYYFRKCEPYEGSSRIPLLIQVSSEFEFKSGLKCNRPVCLEDIMPTMLESANISVPEYVDGKSLLPILRGENTEHRNWLHGEHAPCYSQRQAYHFLTDGKMKYIWRPLDGSEQLFDLENDSKELHDLTLEESNKEQVELWRRRLIEHLSGRPEGFTDGRELISGRPYKPVLPHIM